MYKEKIDGDHCLDFLLLLFFHQGKKRRTVPRGNHMAKLMQSSAITIKDQSIFIQISLRAPSQKQKHGEDNPPLSQANETLPMDHMYKAKRDGDHRLDFLLLLFFHQEKKRRTVPRGNYMAKLMQSSAITIKDQSIFIPVRLRAPSQKQKHGEDNPPLSQANETLPMDHMYKAKRDGDHLLDFLLLLFFHQGKKRRTVPRGNHMAKLMQSSAITIKDQSIFIQISLRARSQN